MFSAAIEQTDGHSSDHNLLAVLKIVYKILKLKATIAPIQFRYKWTYNQNGN